MDNFWMKKRVLITGANGFLGSHLSIELLKRGAFVTGIIKVNPECSFLSISLRQMRNPKIKILKSDIVNFKGSLEIFKKHKPQVCLHIAAQPIVGIANKSPVPTFKANILGTWNVLEAARLCGIGALVVASSDKAYGDQKNLPYSEDSPLLAKNPYDTSKACADMLSRTYAHVYGLPIAVTRCANIYGPGDFNFSRIIPDTIRSVINLRNPVIRSDGTPLRDYVYINDITNAYLTLAKHLCLGRIKAGEAFNFGSGYPISVLNLVKKIIKISRKRGLRPLILGKGRLKGEIDKQYLSTRKARDLLAWKCCYPLEKGLEETYKWYKVHL